MIEQQSATPLPDVPPSPVYVFRAHGWLVSFDGRDWTAANERQQKVIGAAEVLYAVATTAAWKRSHAAR